MRQIHINSPDYAAMRVLRESVLRKPLGLRLMEEDTVLDADAYLLGCFEGAEIKGCLIIQKQPDGSVKLRQVAVDETAQRQGIGRAMMDAAEALLKTWGTTHVFCHARGTAVEFYKARGWRVTGEMFLEQNIPHCRMENVLSVEKTA